MWEKQQILDRDEIVRFISAEYVSDDDVDEEVSSYGSNGNTSSSEVESESESKKNIPNLIDRTEKSEHVKLKKLNKSPEALVHLRHDLKKADEIIPHHIKAEPEKIGSGSILSLGNSPKPKSIMDRLKCLTGAYSLSDDCRNLKMRAMALEMAVWGSEKNSDKNIKQRTEALEEIRLNHINTLKQVFQLSGIGDYDDSQNIQVNLVTVEENLGINVGSALSLHQRITAAHDEIS